MQRISSIIYTLTLFSISISFAKETDPASLLEDQHLTEKAYSQLSRRREVGQPSDRIKEDKKEVAHSDYLQLHSSKSLPEKMALVAEKAPKQESGLNKKKFVLRKQIQRPKVVARTVEEPVAPVSEEEKVVSQLELKQEVITESSTVEEPVAAVSKEEEVVIPPELMQEVIAESSKIEPLIESPLVAEALPSQEIAQNQDPVPPPSMVVQAQQPQTKQNFLGINLFDHHATFRSLFGDGIGFDRGYTSLDLFLSGEIKHYWRLFTDLRGHLFENARWAANAGLGVRRKGAVRNLIAGANLYYDYRETKHKSFNQIAGGLELLGSLWDFRLNGYLPFDASHSFDRNDGHKRHVVALGGGNIEVERMLWWSRNLDISAAISGYYLHGSDSKNAGGGLFRIAAHATPYMIIRGQISYDNLFQLRGSGEIALTYPFGGKKNSTKPKHGIIIEEKVRRSPERFEIIPIYETKKH